MRREISLPPHVGSVTADIMDKLGCSRCSAPMPSRSFEIASGLPNFSLTVFCHEGPDAGQSPCDQMAVEKGHDPFLRVEVT